MSVIYYKDGQQKRIDKPANIDYSELLDFFYPVGSFYETTDTNFDPNDSWRRYLGKNY